AFELEREIADAGGGEVGQRQGARVVELVRDERHVDAELESIEDGEAADEIHAELALDQPADERAVAAADVERILAVAQPQAGGEAEVRRDEGAVDTEVTLRGDRGVEALGVEGGRARLGTSDGGVGADGGDSDDDGDEGAPHAWRRRRTNAARRSAPR